MASRLLLLVSWAVALGLPGVLRAQDPAGGAVSPAGATAPVGSRVRVTTSAEPASELVGAVEAWGPASVTVREESAEPLATQVPLSDVARLEMSRGSQGHAGTGAWIGGGIGLAAGVALAIFAAGADDDGLDNLGGTSGVILGVGATTALGAGVGALIGSAVRTERWEEISIP